MGRPWWYDSYWERQRGQRPQRRWRFPRGQARTWLILLAAVALIAWLRT